MALIVAGRSFVTMVTAIGDSVTVPADRGKTNVCNVRTRGGTWFVAWMLIGGLWLLTVLGALSIGIFVLPVALVMTIMAVNRPRSWVGRPGVVTGMGLPLLFVAWLNRDGPGYVCRPIKTGETCDEQWSPWPFYLPGVVLVVGGIVWFVRRRARVGTMDELVRK